jgi:hypothetical protein
MIGPPAGRNTRDGGTPRGPTGRADDEEDEPMTEDAVPEADALEQRTPVADDDGGPEEPAIDDEVPEADALDQARPVPMDEDDAPR